MNRLDFIRADIEVSETFSNGRFGAASNRSSRRVIPMSSALRGAFERRSRPLCGCRDLVFCTTKGTPLNPKNLDNRVRALDARA